MENELAAMDALGLFEWCFIPLGSNLISCKWILVTKWNANSSLNKYHARLVVRDFTQVHGLDYFDTFCVYGLPHGYPSGAGYSQQHLYGVRLP